MTVQSINLGKVVGEDGGGGASPGGGYFFTCSSNFPDVPRLKVLDPEFDFVKEEFLKNGTMFTVRFEVSNTYEPTADMPGIVLYVNNSFGIEAYETADKPFAQRFTAGECLQFVLLSKNNAPNGFIAMFIPDSIKYMKNTVIGVDANAIGVNNVVIGQDAIVRGASNTEALKGYDAVNNSIAIGESSMCRAKFSAAYGPEASIGLDADFSLSILGANVPQGSKNSIAIGANAATGINMPNAIALGSGAKTLSQYAIAIGSDTQVNSGGGSIAIGYATNAKAVNAVVIGATSISSAERSIALGPGIIMSNGADNSIAIGDTALVAQNCNKSIAIGYKASAKGAYSTAIGLEASANSMASVALGGSIVYGSTSVALGGATVGSEDSPIPSSVGIGNANVEAPYSIAIGNASSKGESSIAMGLNAVANSVDSICIGDGATVYGNASVAIGNADVGTVSSVSNNAIAIGSANVIGIGTISIGGASEAYGTSNINIGMLATTGTSSSTVSHSISIGSSSAVASNDAISIGHTSRVQGSNSIALGTQTFSAGDSSVALGNNSYVPNTLSNVISVGSIARTEGSTQIEAFTRRIINVSDPVDDSDAATKAYVDAHVGNSSSAGEMYYGYVNPGDRSHSGKFNIGTCLKVNPAFSSNNSRWNTSSTNVQYISLPYVSHKYFAEMYIRGSATSGTVNFIPLFFTNNLSETTSYVNQAVYSQSMTTEVSTVYHTAIITTNDMIGQVYQFALAGTGYSTSGDITAGASGTIVVTEGWVRFTKIP